jgi:hypothetical protein
MPNLIFSTMLSRYEIQTKGDRINGQYEEMQQISPTGLYRDSKLK